MAGLVLYFVCVYVCVCVFGVCVCVLWGVYFRLCVFVCFGGRGRGLGGGIFMCVDGWFLCGLISLPSG